MSVDSLIDKARSIVSFTRVELAVLASGISSMGLEILAGRMISPEFGSSIYTWGTIIGVFLASLALGYQRGGEKADSELNHNKLGGLLVAATAYIAFILVSYEYILVQSRLIQVPSRFGSFVPVTILFAPPTYYLGYISPYAAELSQRESTGDAAGHIYALGTFGSIIGAFATTYLLIPYFSIIQIGIILGGVLLITAVYIMLPDIPKISTVKIILVVVALVGVPLLTPPVSDHPGETVYQTQTPYQELEVVDNDNVRTLYLDGLQHSAMHLNNPDKHIFNYTKNFYIPFLMQDDINNVLFIGGGGFTGPKMFAERPNVSVDVVELDPIVFSTAKEYFNVSESDDLDVHIQDGREYVRSTNETYDLIILDAYKKSAVPFHLTTQSFMQLTKEKLDQDGMVLSNLISAEKGPASVFYKSEYKTMNTVYPQVYSFPTTDNRGVQNIILIGTKSDRQIQKQTLLQRSKTRNINTNLRYNLQFYTTDVNTTEGIIIRDEKAPVARLMSPMVGKKYIVEESSRSNASGET